MAIGKPNPYGTTGLMGWIDDRFPATKLWKDHVSEYYAPKNFNFWYFFGSLAMLVLANQLITGIFLTMHYKPSTELGASGLPLAFESVEYIMRDVSWGWLIRYMHSTGASAFFVVVYLHMFRGLIYGSYRKPRELIWLFGWLIFFVLMAEAFMGYLLPWGNMSYWGAQVIISLFGALPVIGPDLVVWIQGDFVPSDATLNRFFALHVVALPIVLIFLVIAHLMALHEVGSNNPDGIDIKEKKDENGVPLDGIPFHPYYTVKDIMGVAGFAIIFAAVLFFAPEGGGYFLEKPNFTAANPLATPEHIAPVWYFTPFYTVLRAIPDKLFGVLGMGAAVVLIALLPWLDRSPVRSIRYKGGIYKTALTLFVISFLFMGWLGFKSPDDYTLGLKNIYWGQITTLIYFAFFLLMPIYTKLDKTKPVPDRVTFHEHDHETLH